jgi:hypothetical protein
MKRSLDVSANFAVDTRLQVRLNAALIFIVISIGNAQKQIGLRPKRTLRQHSPDEAKLLSQAQSSPAPIVDAVVNSSLNVFGSADVSMHTLDLQAGVKRLQHAVEKHGRALTVQWEVAVLSFQLLRLDLKCVCQNMPVSITPGVRCRKLTADKHRKRCNVGFRGENLRKLDKCEHVCDGSW